jgi:hypothetical protein
MTGKTIQKADNVHTKGKEHEKDIAIIHIPGIFIH